MYNWICRTHKNIVFYDYIHINKELTMEQIGTNPYHFVSACIKGKWKMTLLHEIHFKGSIRFNQTLNHFPISEKVLSQQLRELIADGLIERIQYNTIPLKVEYKLTSLGEDLIPALDILYIWAMRRMDDLDVEIDPNCFDVHTDRKYTDQLEDILNAYKRQKEILEFENTKNE
jgi:DNA-binding HxlR family transcriptional regulator